MAQIIKQNVKVGDVVVLVRPFKIFRQLGDKFDICDDDGNCLTASQKELFLSRVNNDSHMKAMKDAVLKVAQDLAKAKNTVTTLEIKVELRRDYPYYFWDQKTVSAFMDGLAGDGLFTYTDNGTYRIYSLVGCKVTSTPTPVLTKTLTKTIKAGKKTANTVSTIGVSGVKVGKISWPKVLNLAGNPNFQSFILKNGTVVDKNTIKAQKKSPLGYVTPKVGKVAGIVVGSTQYNVK